MSQNDKAKGRLLVVSGYSGVGKGTVIKALMEQHPEYVFSVSATTRAARPGEVDGREYFFIDRERFVEMIENDELLEHAMYVGNAYGTPRKFVEDKLAEGMNVLLDIEVQGARQVAERMPEAIRIFVVPPTLEELRRRLEGRGTETAASIEGRLERARQEYGEATFYDYIIVNDLVEVAAQELAAIITAEHCRAAERMEYLENI